MSADEKIPPELARYARQIAFEPIGAAGQRRIRLSSVALVGCGALGSAIADQLIRAGIGSIRIVDRDYIDLTNLQRQALFDEHDIAQNLPKAEAAVRKLRKVNSAAEVEGIVADVLPTNIADLCGDADLLLDGTDNLETRYLINDFAVRQDLPWVYAGCISAEGRVLPIVPGDSPCLRCVWPDAPEPGSVPTCESVGVLGAAAHVTASLAAVAAMKLLMGDHAHAGWLSTFDVWAGRMRTVDMREGADRSTCVCCGQRQFEFLEGGRAVGVTVLCGQNAVQLTPPEPVELNLRRLAERVPARAKPLVNEFLLRFSIDGYTVAAFPDGRIIVSGTADETQARAVCAKYIGV